MSVPCCRVYGKIVLLRRRCNHGPAPAQFLTLTLLVTTTETDALARCSTQKRLAASVWCLRLARVCTPQTHVKTGFVTYQGHLTVSLFSLQSMKRNLDMQRPPLGLSPFSFPSPAFEIDISISSYPTYLSFIKLLFLISLVGGAHSSFFSPARQWHSLSLPLLNASEPRRSSGRSLYSPESLQPSSSAGKTSKKYGGGRFEVVTIPVVVTVGFSLATRLLALTLSSSPEIDRPDSSPPQSRSASTKGGQDSLTFQTAWCSCR